MAAARLYQRKWWLIQLPIAVLALGLMAQLRGQRVSIGDPGSGTRRLARALLGQVRLAPEDIVESKLQGLPAVDALRQGLLDAARTLRRCRC